MICDDCVKKTVCKMCDGSEIKGCIEFYRSHKEVLKEICREIEAEEQGIDDADGMDKWLAGIKQGMYDSIEIINKKIKEDEDEDCKQ